MPFLFSEMVLLSCFLCKKAEASRGEKENCCFFSKFTDTPFAKSEK